MANGNPFKVIPKSELRLPVAIRHDGKFVTAEQLMLKPAAKAAVMTPIAAIDSTYKRKIAKERIKRHKSYRIGLIGPQGPLIIDQTKALEEIATDSDIGKVLVELEYQVVLEVLTRLTPDK